MATNARALRETLRGARNYAALSRIFVSVAATGIELMLKGGVSKIVGPGNHLRALSLRMAARRMVAGISKKLLAGSRRSAQGA